MALVKNTRVEKTGPFSVIWHGVIMSRYGDNAIVLWDGKGTAVEAVANLRPERKS